MLDFGVAKVNLLGEWAVSVPEVDERKLIRLLLLLRMAFLRVVDSKQLPWSCRKSVRQSQS